MANTARNSRLNSRIFFTLFLLMGGWSLVNAQNNIGSSEFLTLPVCPESPNCVSSQAENPKQQVEPFYLLHNNQDGWIAVQEWIATFPRVTRELKPMPSSHAAHWIEKSRIFRFIDDIHLIWNPTTGRIDVRSASRSGHYDFGVNRKRVERWRKSLQDVGYIQ